MSIVILGDVASTQPYHVGDEAMTEYALDAFRERGVDNLTVVGADPELAEERFGTASVPRIGFDGTKPAVWRKARFDALLATLAGDKDALTESDPAHLVIDAVKNSTGVLIAGGGNIASKFINHLTERLALATIARHFEVPLVLSSQTYGPELKPQHAEQVLEMMSGAALVGARERPSYDLALALGSDPERTYRGIDDAFWLRPKKADRERVARLNLPDDYMLASFTAHAGSTGMSRPDFYRQIAETLNALVDRFQLPVFLISHVGSLTPELRSFDQLANDIIAGIAASKDVIHLPMLTAREVVAVTEGATFNLSSRYHPAVFGTAAGVPSMGIALSLYSSVKLRGALGNVGLADYAIQAASWRPERVVDAAETLLADRSRFDSHMHKVIASHQLAGKAWWDTVTATLTGSSTPPKLEPVAEIAAFERIPSWSEENRAVTAIVEATDRKLTERGWARDHAKWQAAKFEKAVAQVTGERDKVAAERDALKAERDRLAAKIEKLTKQAGKLQERAEVAERKAAAAVEPVVWRAGRKIKRALSR